MSKINLTMDEIESYNKNYLRVKAVLPGVVSYTFLDDFSLYFLKICKKFDVKCRLSKKMFNRGNILLGQIFTSKRNCETLENYVFPELEKIHSLKGTDMEEYNDAKNIFRELIKAEMA